MTGTAIRVQPAAWRGPSAALVLAVLLGHALVLWSLQPGRLWSDAAAPAKPLQTRLVTAPAAPAPPTPSATLSTRPAVPSARPPRGDAMSAGWHDGQGPSAATTPTAAAPAPMPAPEPSPVAAAPAASASLPMGANAPKPAPPSATETPPTPTAPAAPAPALAAPPQAPPADHARPQAASSPSPWPRPLLPPAPMRLAYSLTGMDRGLNYHANGELRWQHDGTAYRLSLEVRMFLLGGRRWDSQGLLGEDGLQPHKFVDKARQERAVHLDRDGQRLVFSSRGQAQPLAAGVQDFLSLPLQLAAALQGAASGAAAQASPVGELRVPVVTATDAQLWTVRPLGAAPLTLGGQAVPTWHWQAVADGRFDSRVDIWASPAHQHLPVRLRITQSNGSFVDLQMNQAEMLAPGLP